MIAKRAERRLSSIDYAFHVDFNSRGSQIDRIRALMLDGEWRTPAEICHLTGLSPTADITKQLRHLRYLKYGQHQVNRRRRIARSLFEYQVLESGTGYSCAPKRGAAAQLEAAQDRIDQLAHALACLAPQHPLLAQSDE